MGTEVFLASSESESRNTRSGTCMLRIFVRGNGAKPREVGVVWILRMTGSRGLNLWQLARVFREDKRLGGFQRFNSNFHGQ